MNFTLRKSRITRSSVVLLSASSKSAPTFSIFVSSSRRASSMMTVRIPSFEYVESDMRVPHRIFLANAVRLPERGGIGNGSLGESVDLSIRETLFPLAEREVYTEPHRFAAP